MAARIYPAADLEAWLNTGSDVDTGMLCGLSRAAIVGWRARRTMFTEKEADRYAIRFGVHPCEIWGELWWESLPEAV